MEQVQLQAGIYKDMPQKDAMERIINLEQDISIIKLKATARLNAKDRLALRCKKWQDFTRKILESDIVL